MWICMIQNVVFDGVIGLIICVNVKPKKYTELWMPNDRFLLKHWMNLQICDENSKKFKKATRFENDAYKVWKNEDFDLKEMKK